MNPSIIADSNWQHHCEEFFTKMTLLEGVRLPEREGIKSEMKVKY